jgi:transposase-like protein
MCNISRSESSRICRRNNSVVDYIMKQKKWYSKECKERAVQMVQELQSNTSSQGEAITPMASKLGCTPESLRPWIRQM